MTRTLRYLLYLGLLCLLVLWVALFGPETDADPPAAAPAPPAARERGQYLAERVCLCGDCHSPRTPKGEPDRSHWLQGAPLVFKPMREMPNWGAMAPPIAGGYPGWSPEQLTAFMETGKTPQGDFARPPMPAYRLTRDDAAALTAYLQSLPTAGQ